MSIPIGQLQTNTTCSYSNQRPAVTVPPHTITAIHCRTMSCVLICLLSLNLLGNTKSVSSSTVPERQKCHWAVLNGGKQLAKREVFRGVWLKLRDVWSVECPLSVSGCTLSVSECTLLVSECTLSVSECALSVSKCAHSVSPFALLTAIHISFLQTDAPFHN